MSMIPDPLQLHLQQWLMRKTVNSAVRRVGELPIALTSDLGLVREENQDRLAVLRVCSRTHSFIVAALCDGIGGMAHGALSASIALSSFLVSCVRNTKTPVKNRLAPAAFVANKTVYEAFHGGGGATLSAFIVDNSGAMAGINIGDSRIYGVTNGSLEQLTVDDTIAGQFNKPNRNQDDHPGRNELLQYIGVGSDIEPHFIPLSSPVKFSTLLLTTDGIHFINPTVIQSVVLNAKDPPQAIQRLAELSRWCGGSDNASAIVTKYTSGLMNVCADQLPDVIDVWDAFGDLRLVGIDRNHLFPLDHPLPQPDSPTDAQLSRDKQGAAKVHPAKPPRKKRKTKGKGRKKAAAQKPATGGIIKEDERDTKPQLKIDFDDDEVASDGPDS